MRGKTSEVEYWNQDDPLVHGKLNQAVRAIRKGAGLIVPTQQDTNPEVVNEQSDETTPPPADVKMGRLEFHIGLTRDIEIPIYDLSEPPVQIGTATAEKMYAMYLKRGDEIFLVELED